MTRKQQPVRQQQKNYKANKETGVSMDMKMKNVIWVRLSADTTVNGLCDVGNVLFVETGHGDTAILGHVDMELGDHAVDLGGVEAGE